MDCLFSSSSLINTTQGYSIVLYSCHYPFSHLRAPSKRCHEQIVVLYLMPNVLFAYEISTSINNMALKTKERYSSEAIHYTIVPSWHLLLHQSLSSNKIWSKIIHNSLRYSACVENGCLY